MNRERAKELTDKIVTDILERKGLGSEFQEVEPHIQLEIKEAWTEIILDKPKPVPFECYVNVYDGKIGKGYTMHSPEDAAFCLQKGGRTIHMREVEE